MRRVRVTTLSTLRARTLAIFASFAIGSIGCAKIDSGGLGPNNSDLDGSPLDSGALTDTTVGPGDVGDDDSSRDVGLDGSADGAVDVSDATDAFDTRDALDTLDTRDTLDTLEAGDTADAGPCAPSPGTAGQALEISSSIKSYLEATYFPIPPDFTLEAWVLPGGAGEQLIVAKDQQGTLSNQFRFGITSGKLYFMMSDTVSADGGLWAGHYVLEDDAPLTIDKWSHVAIVKSGTLFSLYTDARLVASFTATKSLFHTGTAPFRIGARAGGGGAPVDILDGSIDEVRVFRIARTAAEIACDRFHELTPAHPQYYSLAAYWKMDEGTGTTAADSLVAFPATLHTGPKWVASTAF